MPMRAVHVTGEAAGWHKRGVLGTAPANTPAFYSLTVTPSEVEGSTVYPETLAIMDPKHTMGLSGDASTSLGMTILSICQRPRGHNSMKSGS